MMLQIFQRQVADQASLALRGAEEIEAFVASTGSGMDQFWGAVQIFVTSTGNVAKALWGAGGRRSEERARLRESLGVVDDSPLKDVTLRNHFEHFDERIDRWWAASERHMHLDRLIGPPEIMGSFEEIEQFRIYDPDRRAIFFWGEQFDVAPLTEELGRVGAAARAQLDIWPPR